MTRLQTRSMKSVLSAAAAFALAATVSGCGRSAEPTAADIDAAMTTYLAQRGDLCLAKAQWPIDVTEREIRAGARNAVQMPVLEKLGLVTMGVAEVDALDDDGVSHHMKVRRYAMTDAGKKFYVVRTVHGANGKTLSQGDFCAAKLSLDKVVGWSKDTSAAIVAREAAASAPADVQQMVVTYTYHVTPAPWATDADAQKVFPVVAGVIRGDGVAQLNETVRLTDHGWVAVELL